MSVTDFECAIAKSQIGRYIAGDNLAPEVARQLESHIDNCSRCKQLLQEKKNSLEAMISGNAGVKERTTINVTNQPVPMTRPTMTDGSSALKPDFIEVLADSARLSLSEKLKDSVRTKPDMIEVPTVAPAFAYKDAVQNKAVKLKLDSSDKPMKKKSFWSNFSLYHDVPDEEVKPSLSVENIRSAKAVYRASNPSMRKPAMYLAGLCCVVAAMSLVLRDPTTLFGGKAAEKNAIVVPIEMKGAVAKVPKNTPTKVAKILAHKPVQLNDSGTDAEGFVTSGASTPTSKRVAKPKASTKSTVAPKTKPSGKAKAKAQQKISLSSTRKNKLKAAKHPAPALVRRISAKHGVRRSHAQHSTFKKSLAHSHKVVKTAAKTNDVKIYPDDQTPNSKSSTSGEQN
jgi:hypothetical protein